MKYLLIKERTWELQTDVEQMQIIDNFEEAKVSMLNALSQFKDETDFFECSLCDDWGSNEANETVDKIMNLVEGNPVDFATVIDYIGEDMMGEQVNSYVDENLIFFGNNFIDIKTNAHNMTNENIQYYYEQTVLATDSFGDFHFTDRIRIVLYPLDI